MQNFLNTPSGLIEWAARQDLDEAAVFTLTIEAKRALERLAVKYAMDKIELHPNTAENDRAYVATSAMLTNQINFIKFLLNLSETNIAAKNNSNQ